MNVVKFLEILSVTKLNHPFWFELDDYELASKEEIEKFEIEQGIILPDSYKDFLLYIGGGEFSFTNIFSLKSDSVWNLNIINKNLNLFPNFIAISDNQVGDYFGFKINHNECEEIISFYNHDEKLVEKTKYQNIFEYLLDVALKYNK